jgi:hypothetical protein
MQIHALEETLQKMEWILTGDATATMPSISKT